MSWISLTEESLPGWGPRGGGVRREGGGWGASRPLRVLNLFLLPFFSHGCGGSSLLPPPSSPTQDSTEPRKEEKQCIQNKQEEEGKIHVLGMGTWYMGRREGQDVFINQPKRPYIEFPWQTKEKRNFVNVFEFLPGVQRRKMGKSWSVIKVIKMPFHTTISRTNW